MVGLGGQQLHPVAQVVRMDEGVEAMLQHGLVIRCGSGRAEGDARAKKDDDGEGEDGTHRIYGR